MTNLLWKFKLISLHNYCDTGEKTDQSVFEGALISRTEHHSDWVFSGVLINIIIIIAIIIIIIFFFFLVKAWNKWIEGQYCTFLDQKKHGWD